MKVDINYVSGSSTISTMSEQSFEQLSRWFMNPKSSKFYRINGKNILLIHKSNIAYILTSEDI